MISFALSGEGTGNHIHVVAWVGGYAMHRNAIRKSARSSIEALEPRRLLSVSMAEGNAPNPISPSDNVNTIIATANNGSAAATSLEMSSITTSGGGRGTLTIKDNQTFQYDLGAETVIIDAGASATFDVSQHLDKLVLIGSAAIAPGGGKVLDAKLSIDGGSLDVADNDLIVRGFDVGSWDVIFSKLIASHVITSSTAQSQRTGLGVATAGNALSISGQQTATFDGLTVSPSDVLIKFTYLGDVNLDGKVNIDDYGRIDGNIGSSGSAIDWYNGDFNYDGKIDKADYDLMDGIIGTQGPVL